MGKAWSDKEHAAEAQYFNKKDAELLAKLANKLHAHTAVRCIESYCLQLRAPCDVLMLSGMHND